MNSNDVIMTTTDLKDNKVESCEKSNKSIMTKLKKFVAGHKSDLACFIFLPLFILVVFAVMLYAFDVYPFGKNTMSSYDMLAQVAPFIEHLFDVIDGKSTLFYTYAIAGGVDVFGTLAYCCISPFTFIFLLFGDGNVYYGTSIVLPLKIVCVSISAMIYLKKRFKNINCLVQCALALSYAFCGYLFVSNTYINWVDLLIWLPIAAYGFKNVIDGKKKTLFVLGTALMIYTCFSISCFALFTIFPIAIIYCFVVLEKQKRKKVVTDIVLALCLTVAVSLPILIPSLWAFLVSGRKTGIFDNLFNDIAAEPLYYKISYLCTDGLTLTFTFVYFFKNGVKRPIDRFLLISAALVCVPVIIDQSMNLLNFGSYMSYALRFGFLNGFYFLFVSSSYFDEYFASRKITKTDGYVTETNDLKNNSVNNLSEQSELIDGKVAKIKRLCFKKNNLKFGIILSLLLACATVGIIVLQTHLLDGTFVKSFSARFAHSLGGLEATAIICAIVAIIALYAHLLMKNDKLSAKIALPILLLVVCGQSVFYSSHLVAGNCYEPTRYNQIKTLTDYVKELDGNKNSRVKMCGDYLTADMPFTLDTNAFSVFSSVIDSRNFVPTTFFEYGGNGSNTMKSYNGTTLGDALLGYKYYISNSTTRSYLNRIDGCDDLLDENGNKKDVGEYSLYENPYVFPSAFTVYSVPQKNPLNKFDEYSQLMQSLTQDENALSVFEIPASNAKETSDDGAIRVRNVLQGYGNYYFYFDFEDYENISYAKGSVYNAENLKELPDNKVISLGYGSSGSYSVWLKRDGEPLTKEYILEHVKTFCVLDSTVKSIAKRTNAEDVSIELSAGKITAKVSNANEGQYLFLNYIYLPEGHTVKINGEVAEFEDNLLNFIYVKLQPGYNEVEIEYSSPYVKLCLIGITFAVLFVGLYYVLFIKKKIRLTKLQSVITVSAYCLTVFIILFFFIMPICVFIYKGGVSAFDFIKTLFARF